MAVRLSTPVLPRPGNSSGPFGRWARSYSRKAPSSRPDHELAEAKELFRQGNAVRMAGDYERALDYYRRSQALVPAVPNTMNSAICLSKLGRIVEASR